MTQTLSSDISAGALRDPVSVHRRLARWNHRRLAPASPHEGWAEELSEEHRMRRLEGAWVEAMRAEVAEAAAEAPQDEEGFVRWFEGLKSDGPGQYDPLFDWLAADADEEALRWFLTQEAAGEAGFDDLVALAQVKLPSEAKLELARNYWDEMGRGHAGGMHGPMLDTAVAALGLTPTIEGAVWESLALANTLTAFVTTRRYAWHAVGALGVVELTAPTRVSRVSQGLKRLGMPPVVRKYFDLHAQLDLKHADDWIANCLRPLLREDPSRAPWLAEGALIRLTCGLRCFEAYRRRLWSRPGLAVAAE
ncbi:MAG: iron-containing redox enzyme family protein [Proteobacteria bacterium]|nr:iron-containing redox enzyme family protein [Pseudomonadota bacterium]